MVQDLICELWFPDTATAKAPIKLDSEREKNHDIMKEFQFRASNIREAGSYCDALANEASKTPFDRHRHLPPFLFFTVSACAGRLGIQLDGCQEGGGGVVGGFYVIVVFEA